MKISVALITYNSEQFLRPQIDTILENLGPEDEIVVSDDGSTDSTKDILASYASKDPRFHLFSIVHSGCNANYENAISHCTGDLIFLSDDDNVWLPNKVSAVKEVFQKNPGVWFVMHDCQICDQDLNEIRPSFFKDRNAKPGLFRNIMKCSYGGSLIAFRKELTARILPFPKKMPVFYDEWVGLEASKHGKVYFLPQILSKWRRHGGSASTGFISSNGQVVSKKKAQFKGSFKRFHQRIHTRVVKLWWALVK
jgi:glycosyltransferase involved in cell wall biosynthesis